MLLIYIFQDFSACFFFAFLNNQDYFLEEIKKLQIPINLFFETIIVNVENKEIKENRLNLMFGLKELIIKYSNFDVIED